MMFYFKYLQSKNTILCDHDVKSWGLNKNLAQPELVLCQDKYSFLYTIALIALDLDLPTRTYRWDPKGDTASKVKVTLILT